MFALLFAQGLPGAGPAIMVSLCLAFFGIVAFYLIAYFSHCFLVVVIDSAAGIDEIRWPGESITDWFTKPIYVIWVLLPIFFVATMAYAATGNGLTFGIVLLALLWLVAPLMFLSSLAA